MAIPPVVCRAAMVASLLASVALGRSPASIPSPPGADDATTARLAELHARGIDYGFNLDHPEALATFRDAIALDPSDARAYRMAAATLWVSVLLHQGIITTDDYMGQARASLARKAPPPATAAAFRHYTSTAVAIADKRVRENPADADAHFQLGAAAGFQASYATTVEGRVLGGLGPARRAYAAHKRCLDLDPSRRDAGLIVGMYLYGVAALPPHMRLLARLAGFGSGREEGVRLVEQAAAHPGPGQTNARFTLILFYNREGRHAEALRVIEELRVRYPRNRLLWLEAGTTAMRAGRPADALKALNTGVEMLERDPRPRAFGEDGRWRYHRGAALAALRQDAQARRELDAALQHEGPRWVKGRAHLELGKLADLRGERAAAVTEYRLAMDDCRADRDTTCTDGARQLASRPWNRSLPHSGLPARGWTQ